jgi:hypothetical protein
MTGNWTDQQKDAIVADCFAMFADDIAGHAKQRLKSGVTIPAQPHSHPYPPGCSPGASWPVRATYSV